MGIECDTADAVCFQPHEHIVTQTSRTHSLRNSAVFLLCCAAWIRKQRRFFARPLRLRGKALESIREKSAFRYLVVHGAVTTAEKLAERGGQDESLDVPQGPSISPTLYVHVIGPFSTSVKRLSHGEAHVVHVGLESVRISLVHSASLIVAFLYTALRHFCTDIYLVYGYWMYMPNIQPIYSSGQKKHLLRRF